MPFNTYLLKKAIIVLSLFAMQCILIFAYDNGVVLDLINPFALLIISLCIPYYYFVVLKKEGNAPLTLVKNKNQYLFLLAGVATIAVSYRQMHKLFAHYSNPIEISDVMPQIETLYSRFIAGVFPYTPVTSIPWAPYPVYMPLHWLPIAIPHFLHIDSRWVGFMCFAAATGIYAYYLLRNNSPAIIKFIALLLPSVVLWIYILFGSIDIPAALEPLIAGYYLVLAVGLASRNLTITTIGIILCLLSRYTFLFWLPLFFILLWQTQTLKRNLWVWTSIILSVLLIYIIPFFLKDPTIFAKGLAYHNHCAVDEWKRFGDPTQWNSYHSGIFFAPRFYDLFHGTIEHRVFLNRVVQAVLMLFLFFAGWFGYQRVKDKINFYDVCLIMLYTFVVVFILFSPITFKYYYMSILVLSSVICAKTLMTNNSKS